MKNLASSSCADPFFILAQPTVVPHGPHAIRGTSPGGPLRSSRGVPVGLWGHVECCVLVLGGAWEAGGASLGRSWKSPGGHLGSVGGPGESLGEPWGSTWVLEVPKQSLGDPWRVPAESLGDPWGSLGLHEGICVCGTSCLWDFMSVGIPGEALGRSGGSSGSLGFLACSLGAATKH